jgi:hypothetical protein
MSTMYQYLKKAQTEVRIAQLAIVDGNSDLYAKLDEVIYALEDMAEEQLDKEVA